MAHRVIASGRSCLECRRRKIKCDRSLPCAYCKRIKLQCTYPPWQQNRSTGGEEALEARVQFIESALQSLEQKITRIGSLLQVGTELPSRQDHGEQGHQFPTDTDHDLPSPSWSSPRGNNSRFTPSKHNAATQSTNPHLLQSLPFNNLVGVSQPRKLIHPTPAKILFIWQTYLDVVDPLLKISHVPSTQRHIMSISQGREVSNVAAECLLFAIYYSTVISISAAECREELDEEKPVLLQRYRQGIEQSLVRANFLNSQSITVLQAFVTYLICGRQDENGPDVCALIGLAIGNAMKLGLHIDIPGMPVFELEMRRRLWWQIHTLDVRIAEDFGGEPFIIESGIGMELPLNVNDITLDPDMGEMPNLQPGRSEMLFSLVRFEVSRFARRILFSDRFCQRNGYQIMNETQKCQAVDQFREHIEKQYLSYCDKAVPFDRVTVTSSLLVLSKLKLAVCKPRADQNHGVPFRADYRNACEEVLGHAHALREYSKGRRWLWLFQTYIEWDALAYLLLDICITLSSLPASSAEPPTVQWKVIDENYSYWKNNPDAHRDRRWVNIEKLRSEALSAKEKAQHNMHPTSPSQSSSQLAHDQSERVSDTAIEMYPQQGSSPGSMYNQHTAMTTDKRSGPLCSSSANINAHRQQSYVTDLQDAEPNTPANRVPLMWALANIAVASAEEVQAPINTADLPGAGTVCEWSASLIEKYWEIATGT